MHAGIPIGTFPEDLSEETLEVQNSTSYHIAGQVMKKLISSRGREPISFS